MIYPRFGKFERSIEILDVCLKELNKFKCLFISSKNCIIAFEEKFNLLVVKIVSIFATTFWLNIWAVKKTLIFSIEPGKTYE